MHISLLTFSKRTFAMAIVAIVTISSSLSSAPIKSVIDAKSRMQNAINHLFGAQVGSDTPNSTDSVWLDFIQDLEAYTTKNATLFFSPDNVIMRYYQALYNLSGELIAAVTSISTSSNPDYINDVNDIVVQIRQLKDKKEVTSLYKSRTTSKSKKDAINVLNSFALQLIDIGKEGMSFYRKKIAMNRTK